MKINIDVAIAMLSISVIWNLIAIVIVPPSGTTLRMIYACLVLPSSVNLAQQENPCSF